MADKQDKIVQYINELLGKPFEEATEEEKAAARKINHSIVQAFQNEIIRYGQEKNIQITTDDLDPDNKNGVFNEIFDRVISRLEGTALAENIFKNASYLPNYYNDVSNSLGLINLEHFEKNELTKTASCNVNGLEMTVTHYDQLPQNQPIIIQKLLDTATAYLTHNNYHKTMADPAAYIPLKEFLTDIGEEINPKKMKSEEAQKKENKRANNRLKYFANEIRKGLKGVKSVTYSTTDKRRQKNKHGEGYHDKVQRYSDTSIISSSYILTFEGVQYIRIVFDFDYAQHLANSYIMQYPTCLRKTDNANKNSYQIGKKLAEHCCMDNNISKGTANTIKIKNVIKFAPFIDTLEEFKSKGRKDWKERIKKRLEDSLQDLKNCGFLIEWHYEHPITKKKYTPATAAKLPADQYQDLNLKFTTLENEELKKRTQRRDQERQKLQQLDEEKKRGRVAGTER